MDCSFPRKRVSACFAERRGPKAPRDDSPVERPCQQGPALLLRRLQNPDLVVHVLAVRGDQQGAVGGYIEWIVVAVVPDRSHELRWSARDRDDGDLGRTSGSDVLITDLRAIRPPDRPSAGRGEPIRRRSVNSDRPDTGAKCSIGTERNQLPVGRPARRRRWRI